MAKLIYVCKEFPNRYSVCKLLRSLYKFQINKIFLSEFLIYFFIHPIFQFENK